MPLESWPVLFFLFVGSVAIWKMRLVHEGIGINLFMILGLSAITDPEIILGQSSPKSPHPFRYPLTPWRQRCQADASLKHV